MRHLLVRLSQERPVLVVIDDAHWAEPTFVDLIEHLVESNGRAPMLVLCLARPEFLEHRSLRTAVTLALEGLTRDESAELLVALAPVSPQSDGDQIVEAAAGNSLFLEQLAAFAAERRSVGGHGVPPASLRSLLSARLDVLGPGERAVLEGASVLGREFETKALADLVPAEARPTLKRHIEVLTLKGLIERDRSRAPFDEALSVSPRPQPGDGVSVPPHGSARGAPRAGGRSDRAQGACCLSGRGSDHRVPPRAGAPVLLGPWGHR